MEDYQKKTIQGTKGKAKATTKKAKKKEDEKKKTNTKEEKKDEKTKTTKDKKETKKKEKKKTEKKAPKVRVTLQVLSSLEETRTTRKEICVPHWAKDWICQVRLRHFLVCKSDDVLLNHTRRHRVLSKPVN